MLAWEALLLMWPLLYTQTHSFRKVLQEKCTCDLSC